MQFHPNEHPHRRYNALSGEWILVSPHRTKRPWQGNRETPAIEQRLEYDPVVTYAPAIHGPAGMRTRHTIQPLSLQ